MIAFKADVRVGFFTDQLATVLQAVSAWSLLTRRDVQITSINDPAPDRVPGSLHAFDLAIDLVPAGNVADDRYGLAEALRRHLPAPFDVVLETSHVHVEWDVHRPPLKEIAG